MQTQPTTPFGRRPLSLAMVASQAATENFAARPGASETVVHKWRLFRALTEAKEPLGVTDRALSVLHALLQLPSGDGADAAGKRRRRRPKADSSGPGIVVFPSNKELSIRAHGMAPATLRRHLACLVDAGLIIRRDSPNGKRFARRGQGGAIEDAFGFDLTPLVARAERDRKPRRRSAGREPGDGAVARKDHADAARHRQDDRDRHRGGRSGRLGRLSPALCDALRPLRAQSFARRFGGFGERTCRACRRNPQAVWKTHVKPQNMSANESQSERHIQNQTTNISDLEPSLQEGRAEPSGLNRPGTRGSIGARDPKSWEREARSPSKSQDRREPIRWGWCWRPVRISSISPRAGISSWRDLATTAAVVRSAIGVSPDAWAQALEVLGEHDASIVIAAILQRGEEIKCAGGYLRVLTAKARAGEFSLGPVLMALLRGKAAKARASEEGRVSGMHWETVQAGSASADCELEGW